MCLVPELFCIKALASTYAQKMLVLWGKGCGSSGAGGLCADRASFTETSDTSVSELLSPCLRATGRPSCLHKAISVVSLLSTWCWLGILCAEMVMIQTWTSKQMSGSDPLPRRQGCLLRLGPPSCHRASGGGGQRSLLKEILCSNEREKPGSEITRKFTYVRERTK